MTVLRKIPVLILLASCLLPAREPESKYGWPLAIRDGVSSSFQEFRSNHFHAGIDMRTFQRTGFPVLAVTDGWIESISVSNRSYGRLLRLRHADGNYSLYGHLDRFRDDIEVVVDRVRAAGGKRYFSNHVLAEPPAVRRGEIIAFSGESGAGFAHLHLEIRDGADQALNPLMLIDNLAVDAYAPHLKGVLVRSRGETQVNGDCGEFYFKLQRQGAEYTLARPLEISGACDIVLEAIDLSDVRHVIAPYSVEASLDGRPVFGVSFERLTRDDNNQLGMLYDMAYSTSGNYFFNLCSQNGFALEKTGGRLAEELARLSPGLHEIRATVSDQRGNRALALLPVLKTAPVGRRPGEMKSETAGGNGNGLMQGIEFVTFVNRGDIVIKAVDFPAPAGRLKLRVTQGGEEQVVPAREYASGVYFAFKPLNHELRMLLRFELTENGIVVEVRQKVLQAVLLKNNYPQTVRFQDFTAEFGPTTVRDPAVLLLEPVALQPDFPLLAGPVRSGPIHFAFLDAVFFKFNTPLGTPLSRQLGIFKYQETTRKWTYVTTRPDPVPGYLSTRVLTAGTYALLRDIFPPAISLGRLKTRHLGKLKRLFVLVSDKGMGIDDASLEVFLNRNRLAGDYDPDWRHIQLEELPYLKKGTNELLVRAADLAGNRVEKRFFFSLK
jgi:hypothetical protein